MRGDGGPEQGAERPGDDPVPPRGPAHATRRRGHASSEAITPSPPFLLGGSAPSEARRGWVRGAGEGGKSVLDVCEANGYEERAEHEDGSIGWKCKMGQKWTSGTRRAGRRRSWDSPFFLGSAGRDRAEIKTDSKLELDEDVNSRPGRRCRPGRQDEDTDGAGRCR